MNLTFREHPELEPSGKVSIFGTARCTAERMSAYAARRNPKLRHDYAVQLYLEKARHCGIRGDVAFCQAMLDTRVWTAEPHGPPGKPFAHTIWAGAADADWSNEEWGRRIELHLRLLFAFASSVEDVETACWEHLNGKWAVPGTRYGQDILAVWRNMMEWRPKKRRAGETDLRRQQADAAVRGDPGTGTESGRLADMAWLAEAGLSPAPSPHPDRKVTWGELARVIRLRESNGKGGSVGGSVIE